MLTLRTGQHYGAQWTKYGDWTVERNHTLPVDLDRTLVASPASVTMQGQVVDLVARINALVAETTMVGQVVDLTYTPPGGYTPRPIWDGVWLGVWQGVQ